MERPIGPNMGPSLLCTFESTNSGFSLFPVRKLSVLRVILLALQHFLINLTLRQVDSTEKKIIQDNCHVPYFEYYICEHSCECTYK
jgi:hypothetical protein